MNHGVTPINRFRAELEWLLAYESIAQPGCSFVSKLRLQELGACFIVSFCCHLGVLFWGIFVCSGPALLFCGSLFIFDGLLWQFHAISRP